MSDNLWVRNALSRARDLFESGVSATETTVRTWFEYVEIYTINERFTWSDLGEVRTALENLWGVALN